jgi:hypothetical protein
VADPPTHRVEVPLRRLAPWLTGFEARHGPWVAAAIGTSDSAGSSDSVPARWQLTADDGTVAVMSVPEWLPPTSAPSDGDDADASGALADLAQLRPPFGVLLLRRAGYAVGLFHGDALIDRKVGARHIHGRTAAGGWSQQRYARRRANQADEIVLAAAAAADRILGGADPAPQFLVTGGDRPLLGAALEHVRRSVAALPIGAHLGIGTPDARVLAEVPDRVLAVQIELPEA